MSIFNKKIGVVGGSKGLGGWWVDYFRAKNIAASFTSADERSELPNNASLVQQSDVVFLCVPINAMEGVLEEIYPHLDGKILVDVCSVKKFVVDGFYRLQLRFPEVQVSYLSIHPMFSQRVRMLEGQVILFNFTNQQGNEFGKALRELLAADKALLYELDYMLHDQVMSIVQGLNHFNVFVSARTLGRIGSTIGKVKDFSSPTYRIFLIFFSRYVLQDPRLYADIQMYNEFVPQVLEVFKEEVERLSSFIRAKDREGFIKYVESSRFYFDENKEDMEISNYLIEQLGIFISKQKEGK